MSSSIQSAGPVRRLIRLPEVMAKIGLRKTAIYALESAGKFPKRIPIGRASAWCLDEIDRWIEERIAARDQGIAERAGAARRRVKARLAVSAAA